MYPFHRFTSPFCARHKWSSREILYFTVQEHSGGSLLTANEFPYIIYITNIPCLSWFSYGGENILQPFTTIVKCGYRGCTLHNIDINQILIAVNFRVEVQTECITRLTFQWIEKTIQEGGAQTWRLIPEMLTWGQKTRVKGPNGKKDLGCRACRVACNILIFQIQYRIAYHCSKNQSMQ